ncbi:serine hydrolase [Zavarzinella formosa]|uniref:serine hydrolase n=1 Tax=Zavarzinella formosa TaxID=360055 RepID=UPI0002E82AA0|nr:serine hydrolase [Zavarzinella formosa]
MFHTVMLCLAALPAAGSNLNVLEQKISALAKAHEGRVSVAVKHLGTGETILLNSGEVMTTASLIKFPIMAEAYAQELAGKVKLDQKITLTKEDMVPGSGILTEHFSPGMTMSLRDAIRLMIVYSDNTATNLVLDQVGIKAVNDRMAAMGCGETRINAKVFKGSTTSVDPARTKQYGLGSTTAKDMVSLLELLHREELVSPAASKAMLAHLKKCEDKDKFPRRLPPSVVVAHKTGSVNEARTDAGILYFPGGPVAVCVLTNQNKDKTWTPDNAGNKLCADIALAVFEHYHQPKTNPKK